MSDIEEWEADLAERQQGIRLAYDRIQRLERTAALVMLGWFAVSMLLLWAVS